MHDEHFFPSILLHAGRIRKLKEWDMRSTMIVAKKQEKCFEHPLLFIIINYVCPFMACSSLQKLEVK